MPREEWKEEETDLEDTRVENQNDEAEKWSRKGGDA